MNILHNNYQLTLTATERSTHEELPITITEIDDYTLQYHISFRNDHPTSAVIELELINENNIFHLIPCNIHGDNNLENAKPGFFPNLSYNYSDYNTSSPIWEFRADRASHPVSMMACDNGAVGISIPPYIEDQETTISNGVFSKLPASAGVSIGYKNRPVTFTSKENMTPSTSQTVKQADITGHIYLYRGHGRLDCHNIIKKVYDNFHEQPTYKHSFKEYLQGFLQSYEHINWSENDHAFTNMDCTLPGQPILHPWRPLIGIGWTGTGVLSYPLLLSQILLKQENSFTEKLESLFEQMKTRINEKSGLFYDLNRTNNGSEVNGWWSGYLVKDCHCAYTNGHGIYYLLKTYLLYEKTKNTIKKDWLTPCLTALNTICELQKEDGNFGYTYSLDCPKILDDKGFAGCWFVPALVLAYQITGEDKYIKSAKKAMTFYHQFVYNLNCYGAPMDTWKSIDQEGNIAFLKGAMLLHQTTSLSLYKQMMIDSANYEYLWRYSFKAKPLYRPLKNSGWNSCGGSVTSVSNPHIHPMGVNCTAPLFYLYSITHDEYHLKRAQDGLYWGLQTADLYPEITGYGQLGVMTERYCPSDGLTIEEYDNGEKSSIWFTFNGWAGVSVLEGLSESLFYHYIDI